MKNKTVKKIGVYLLMSWVLMSCLCLLQGCFSGTGFEKKATLMPDSVGISFNQEQYKGDWDAWYGFGVSAQWNLK